MKTFALDSDDNITVLASAEETDPQPGVERFHSAEQFAALAKGWPAGRLVKIWNQLAGVQPVKKFTDRQTGVTRIWKALESPEPAGAASRPKGGKHAAPKQPRRNVGRPNTKAAQVIALLRQPSGASLKSVMKATGWLAHSVRGFMSGHLRKKLGLRVKSFRRKGERVYSLRG
jgi:hypothetical protein